MLRSSYTVRLPEFEGPLELLLFFVQREELPIAELSIARLVEDFLEYVRLMESLDLELAGEFFVVAAQLMLLKLRFLLRRPSTGGEVMESSEPDDAQLFLERLQQYRRIRYAAAFLALRARSQPLRFYRRAELLRSTVAPLGQGSAEELLGALRRIRARMGQERAVPLPEREPELELTEAMELLQQELRRRSVLHFDLLLHGRPRREQVGLFLAMLELVRMGGATVEQTEPFAEVRIARRAAVEVADVPLG